MPYVRLPYTLEQLTRLKLSADILMHDKAEDGQLVMTAHRNALTGMEPNTYCLRMFALDAGKVTCFREELAVSADDAVTFMADQMRADLHL